MALSELVGKVQTVLGIIDPEQLGITLPHEHFLVGMPIWFEEPTTCSERALAHQPVSLSNLGWVRYHYWESLDNVVMMDEEVAISEGLRFKRAGGSTVVDVTSIGLGRDPLALARISRATDLNIIMGSGYYVEEAQPYGVKLTEEALADEIVHDITVGIGITDIRAGIIGEIGNSWPTRDRDKTALRAVAHAQKQTGAPINIHPGRSPDSPFEIIEVLDNAGADISRVAMSHMERTISDHNTRVRLAKTGCYIEYDMFSWEGWFPARMVLSETNPIKTDLPNDAERINQIMVLISEGFLNQILISHDLCMKHNLWHYGGPGYSHILDNVVPLMRKKGMPVEHIRTILVENPKRLLQFG
jgi:phosphotriesterase-related protein